MCNNLPIYKFFITAKQSLLRVTVIFSQEQMDRLYIKWLNNVNKLAILPILLLTFVWPYVLHLILAFHAHAHYFFFTDTGRGFLKGRSLPPKRSCPDSFLPPNPPPEILSF
jgi:hypothetical protein